jgi:four helix bundle protein
MQKLASLEAWNQGRRLARVAYRLTLEGKLARHFGLADQIRRAAAAIPANIAEGYALATTPQFIRCLRIALGSATELHTHLELARDMELVGMEQADED